MTMAPVCGKTDKSLDFAASHRHSPAALAVRRHLDYPGAEMMKFLLQFFTWWNGQTLNTRFNTWRKGEKVGEDQFGNIYYRTRGGAIDPALGFERRWVIYSGQSEASMVPPGWYGWLHHTSDIPPTQEAYVPREWELPHQPNMTGTPQAWRPQGSLLNSGVRPAATGDYQAWTPGS